LVFVPRELGPIARLVAGTPPALADTVMTHADLGAREAHRQRMDAEVKEVQK
jgi:hypothetical protein